MDPDIAERLREEIAEGRLSSDGRLRPERDLARHLGVSRARLRHALDRLEADGLIYRRQGRGTFAAPPSAPAGAGLDRLARNVTPEHIMEVRLEIEPPLAALAAGRASSEQLARLRQLMEATENLSQRPAYEAADDALHYHIAVAARNPLFLQVFESIRTVRKLATWGETRAESHTPKVMARFGDQHRRLVDAIAMRDMSGAAEAMHLHLRDVQHAVTRGSRPHG